MQDEKAAGGLNWGKSQDGTQRALSLEIRKAASGPTYDAGTLKTE